MTDQYGADVEVQKHILSMLLRDKALLLGGSDVVKPEYFSTDALQYLAEVGYEYAEKYRKTPSLTAFTHSVQKYLVDNKIKKKDRELMLDLAVHCLSDDEYDREFIKDMAYEFADANAMRDEIDTAIGLLAEGKTAKAKSIISNISRSTTMGTRQEEALDYFRKTRKAPRGKKARYFTGMKGLDLITGGMKPKQYGVLVGVSGTFKTGFLINISKGYVSKGLNVLYVSNEQSEYEIQCLFDCCYTGITQDVRVKMTHKEAKKTKKRIRKEQRRSGGTLKIKYYPYLSANMNDIYSLVETESARIEDGEIDCIMLDAVDGFSAPGAINKWDAEAASYMAFEQLVGELDIFGWSTCQVGKDDVDNYITSMSNMRGRAEKAHLASVIVAINRDKVMKQAKSKRKIKYNGFITAPKTRNTPNEQYVSYRANTATLNINTPDRIADEVVMGIMSGKKGK